MRTSTLLLGVTIPFAVALGCTGTIEPMDDAPGRPMPPATGNTPDKPPGTTTGERPPTNLPPGGTTTPPADGTPTPVVPSATACKPGEKASIPRARIWRLGPQQYVNTVKQLFGVDIDVASLPADGINDDKITRYDTNSEINLVNDRLAGAYRDHADKIAGAVVATLATGAHKCVLDATATDACVSGFVKELGGKAFRRPVDDAEATKLVALYKKLRADQDGTGSARGVLTAILQSPFFVYRTELGATAGAKVPLTSHEMASQIAYLVTDGPPDAELLAAAARNELATAADVRKHVERLAGTPAARLKARNFFTAYLRLDSSHTKDKTKFPTFTEALETALVGETMTFVEKTLFEGGGVDTLFSAQHTYVNAAVARHYGLTTTGDAYQKVTAPTGRQGVLSHAAVIAALSGEQLTSPVHRGLFLYQGLLCRPLAAPPANAANEADKFLDPNNPTPTEREKWNYFRQTQSGCAACHSLFHPLGLGFENFDAIGRYRDMDGTKPIDPTVDAVGIGAGLDGKHKNGIEFAQKVVASDDGRACFAMQYATYALGRTIEETEQCRLQSLAEKMKQGNMTFQSLVTALAEDEGFFFRTHQ